MAAPASALDGARQEAFATAIASGCKEGLTQAQAPYSEDAIAKYCACTGSETAMALEPQHLEAFNKAGAKATPELEKMTQRIGAACGNRYLIGNER